MFINCKHCGSLVATDPATDQPPERCPRCRGVLRSAPPAPQVSVASLLRAPPAVETKPQDEAPSAPAVPEPAPASAAPVAPTPTQSPVAQAAPAEEVPDADMDMRMSPAGDIDPAAGVPVEEAASLPAPVARPAPVRASPSFARRLSALPRDARTRRQQRLLIAAVAALSLLLALQVLLADRDRLARDPDWRPTLVRLCGVLRCSLPPWREPAALTVLARDVRPDPARPGELLATATFRNDARWAQAWPRLRLTLSDIDGHPVGTRVFTVDDYLAAAAPGDLLAAGQDVQVQLRLQEPGTRAVSFAFDFL